MTSLLVAGELGYDVSTDLARKVGVSRSTVSRMLRGQATGLRTIHAVLAILKLPYEDVVSDAPIAARAAWSERPSLRSRAHLHEPVMALRKATAALASTLDRLRDPGLLEGAREDDTAQLYSELEDAKHALEAFGDAVLCRKDTASELVVVVEDRAGLAGPRDRPT